MRVRSNVVASSFPNVGTDKGVKVRTAEGLGAGVVLHDTSDTTSNPAAAVSILESAFAGKPMFSALIQI